MLPCLEKSGLSRSINLGGEDPFLAWNENGREFEEARPGVPVTKVESKHFLQEEAYDTIAAKVKELITPLP